MRLTAAAARTTTSGFEDVSCKKRRDDYKPKPPNRGAISNYFSFILLSVKAPRMTEILYLLVSMTSSVLSLNYLPLDTTESPLKDICSSDV